MTYVSKQKKKKESPFVTNIAGINITFFSESNYNLTYLKIIIPSHKAPRGYNGIQSV